MTTSINTHSCNSFNVNNKYKILKLTGSMVSELINQIATTIILSFISFLSLTSGYFYGRATLELSVALFSPIALISSPVYLFLALSVSFQGAKIGFFKVFDSLDGKYFLSKLNPKKITSYIF